MIQLNKKQKILLLVIIFLIFSIVLIYTRIETGSNSSTPKTNTSNKSILSLLGLSSVLNTPKSISLDLQPLQNSKPDVQPFNQIQPHSIATTTGVVKIEGRWDYIKNDQVRSAALLYPLSPYTKSIEFNKRISKGTGGENPQKEFIVLEAGSLQEQVDITDWKILVWSKKKGYKIPKGVTYYKPRKNNTPGNIKIRSGWTAIINTGKSPRGKSFHTNKCSGYAEQFKNFFPSIKLKCPLPNKELEIYGANIPFSDTQCFNIINSTQRCSAIKNISNTITKQCKSFLEEVLTEEGCFEKHRNDSDFLTGIWRIYLNRSEEIYPESDALFLLDKEDKLVDVFHY